MSLVLFTCMVGLLIAPINVDFTSACISLLAVAIGSGAAGTLNMWYESDLDALMSRTCLRPIPTGKIKKNQALYFGIVLSFVSITMLYYSANLISAILLASTIAFYFFIYTIWLKRKTSQNIVIGGAAGALPPVIGWTIATGSISIEPIILFLIILTPIVYFKNVNSPQVRKPDTPSLIKTFNKSKVEYVVSQNYGYFEYYLKNGYKNFTIPLLKENQIQKIQKDFLLHSVVNIMRNLGL